MKTISYGGCLIVHDLFAALLNVPGLNLISYIKARR